MTALGIIHVLQGVPRASHVARLLVDRSRDTVESVKTRILSGKFKHNRRGRSARCVNDWCVNEVLDADLPIAEQAVLLRTLIEAGFITQWAVIHGYIWHDHNRLRNVERTSYIVGAISGDGLIDSNIISWAVAEEDIADEILLAMCERTACDAMVIEALVRVDRSRVLSTLVQQGRLNISEALTKRTLRQLQSMLRRPGVVTAGIVVRAMSTARDLDDTGCVLSPETAQLGHVVAAVAEKPSRLVIFANRCTFRVIIGYIQHQLAEGDLNAAINMLRALAASGRPLSTSTRRTLTAICTRHEALGVFAPCFTGPQN